MVLDFRERTYWEPTDWLKPGQVFVCKKIISFTDGLETIAISGDVVFFLEAWFDKTSSNVSNQKAIDLGCKCKFIFNEKVRSCYMSMGYKDWTGKSDDDFTDYDKNYIIEYWQKTFELISHDPSYHKIY
jgi:hypothetical protein